MGGRRFDSHKYAVLVIALLVVGALDAPSLGTSQEDTRTPMPMVDEDSWTDALDDTSHVYVPDGMYQVEVSGGDAHLATGAMDGWIASEIIRCPMGYRYDLVLLEVDTPGDSYVKVSVLDATMGPTQAGFANASIPEYRKVPATDVSLNHIDVAAYPEIRIQVNLYATATDRPSLLSWTVFFVDEDQWHDDFLGTGKLQSSGGLNITGGTARVRVGDKVLDVKDYDMYPTIGLPTAEGLNFFYCNSTVTGYGDRHVPITKDYWSTVFDDMNGDGYLDMVASDGWTWGDIYWGDETGTFSDQRKGPLNLPALDFATGDFNGDGWKDVAGAVPHGWGSSSVIMLNQGDGVFIKDVNISITGIQSQFAAAGDINGDGYDDVILNTAGNIAYVFFGGPLGPNPTPDAQIEGWWPTVVDLDGDGYEDVIEIYRYGFQSDLYIYMGGPDFDTERDYFLDLDSGNGSEAHAGDINGDGFMDLLVAGNGPGGMYIYPGSASGWDQDNYLRLYQPEGLYEMDVGDLNKDGYDDIVYNHGHPTVWDSALAIAYGGEDFPSDYDFWSLCPMTCGNRFMDVSIAIPKAARYPKHPRGSLVTEDIFLPDDKKWDILNLEGTFPAETWSSVTILDLNGNSIAGLKDIEGMTVDLSGIDPDLNTSIRVRVDIGSWVNTTTPVLDKLTVKWIDRDTWRDQFYTTTRVERSLNMVVSGGTLAPVDAATAGPTIVFPSWRGDSNEYLPSTAYVDAGGAEYLSQASMDIPAIGARAVDSEDMDGDGFEEMVFGVYRTAFDSYRTKSPLYMGSAIGPGVEPAHEFPTQAVTGVLLRDLNEDGHCDMVFAQERDMTSYHVDSVLFWGSEDGWSDTPDVRFKTRGASDVVAADINGDRKLDLVFACFSDDMGGSTSSLVFLQDGAGFSGANPSYQLPTTGARAVAVGDLDEDAKLDLVFACQRDGGVFEMDSRIYWGSPSGGFSPSPTDLPTVGATDVAVADVDGDDDLDLVFANMMNDTHSYDVPSYVYLNDGSGGFSTTPDIELATTGACAVAVGNIDLKGWKDLVFACEQDGDTYMVESCIFLGGTTGWGQEADVAIPTYGASNVMLADLSDGTSGGYLSQEIVPDDPSNLGAFHTLRYTASLGPSTTGKVRMVDGTTWEVLAETDMASGTQEWLVRDLVKVKAHPTVRVSAVVSGLGPGGTFSLDDLWLNWTDRMVRPPQVRGIELGESQLYRGSGTSIQVNVFDEYDLTSELTVVLEHRLNGTTDMWSSSMMGPLEYNASAGTWRTLLDVPIDAEVGLYQFRVTVMDMDSMVSSLVTTGLLEVLNHVPSAPEVRITPEVAFTDTMLTVEIVTDAVDGDAAGPPTYRYRWLRDGVPEEQATASNLLAGHTTKGEVWTVEVRAWDGLDEGPPATAQITILNSPPRLPVPFEGVTIDEDGETSLDLASAFVDADGDPLTWSLAEEPDFLTVTIDQETGVATIVPAADWHGTEELTIVASDGEATASASVMVSVLPVNDVPRFLTVDGETVEVNLVTLSMTNGETRIVPYTIVDVEDDIIWSSVDSNLVELDEARQEIRITLDPDFVGTFEFTLTVWDLVSPEDKVTLDFRVMVENVNDPMNVPRITEPAPGTTVFVDTTFNLEGDCVDPDCQFGQVLTFTWTSNVSGLLGTGASLTVSLPDAGAHTITLTVSDGEFEKSSSVEVLVRARDVEPPPDDGDDDDGGGMSTTTLLAVVIVVVLVIFGVVFLMMRRGRRTPEPEEPSWTPPAEEEGLEPEVERDEHGEDDTP